MSTRSGKRIHGSLHENTPAEPEPMVKSERKTRSRRVKEDLSELNTTVSKIKKRNYVRYPTDDELTISAPNEELSTKQTEEVKHGRVSRKNALKELNFVELEQPEAVVIQDSKNLIRKSRRFKKLSETNAQETEDHENVPEEVVQPPKSKKNKKKKKASIEETTTVTPTPDEPVVEVPVKKSKKKKKKGKKGSSITSLTVEDIPKTEIDKDVLEKVNISTDSFHSAAGSPQLEIHVTDTIIEDIKQPIIETIDKKTNKKNKNKKTSKDVSTKQNNLSTAMDIDNGPDNSIVKGNKRNITPKKDITFDKDNLISDDDSDVKPMTTRQSMTNSKKDSVAKKDNISLINGHDNIETLCVNGSNKKISKSHDTTYEKNASIAKDLISNDEIPELNLSSSSKSRKSNIKDSTFDKSNTVSFTNDKDNMNVSNSSTKLLRTRRSSIKNATFDKIVDTTYEKDKDSSIKDNKNETFDKSIQGFNATFEKDVESDTIKDKKINSNNDTFDKTDKINDTYDKDNSASFNSFKKGALRRKSSIRDATIDKSNMSIASLTKEDFEKDKNISSSSTYRRNSIKRQTFELKDDKINNTFDKTESNIPPRSSLRRSQSITEKLNTTFDKGGPITDANSKSSLISSDNSYSQEKSVDISRISITSDDTTENIINTTPVLIESSMDESVNITMQKSLNNSMGNSAINANISMEKSPIATPTPLKREGTFTKDDSSVNIEIETPSKRKMSNPTAGCTPYHIGNSSQKKRQLNVTRSIEKSRPSDPAPTRMTRVMFCSPVDIPVVPTTEKRKVIKSNLKGSNKSFVFEDTTASPVLARRKRSYTHGEAEQARAKRTRLTEERQHSGQRLARPRTTSAAAKLTGTPLKQATTPKAKSDIKPVRTKLPNFAALHQRRFDKMESLDECQERKAKRAKQLLTPTGSTNLLERISPKNATEQEKKTEPQKPKEKPTNQTSQPKTDTPTKKPPTLETLRPGFSRFGFKLNLDVNPFSVPPKKPVQKPIEVKKPNGLSKPLPSLAGATSVRREVAKQMVMREKSFSERCNVNRNENRTIIKGVRTNRRFELQMKMRNID